MRETRSYRTLCEQRAPLTSGNKRNLPMIDKLAWLTFKEGQLLCARSHGKDIYYIPGASASRARATRRPSFVKSRKSSRSS